MGLKISEFYCLYFKHCLKIYCQLSPNKLNLATDEKRVAEAQDDSERPVGPESNREIYHLWSQLQLHLKSTLNNSVLGSFPWKLMMHIVLLVFTTWQVMVLVNTVSISHNRNQLRVFKKIFLVIMFNPINLNWQKRILRTNYSQRLSIRP